MLTRPAVQSQWLSNRASLMQTRVELSPHDPSVWSLQDNIRRVYAAQLVPAVDMYQRALTLNPRNISAHRRLGQIELSLGRNDSAFAHLAEAYRLADGQRVTRQLLGEMQALEGNVASAVRLWQPLDLSHNQLDARMWWYSERGDIEASSALAAAVRSFNSGASAGAPGTVNP
jgi:Flp pilus assembly protein TadD